MTEEAAMKLKELVSTYNIVDGKPVDKKKTMTIGRLIASAAPVMAKLMKNDAISARSAYLLAPPIAGSANSSVALPKHLRFPGSNCLYPDDEKMCNAYIQWTKEFSLYVTPPDRKKTEDQKTQLLLDAEKFAEVTRNSPILKILNIKEEVRMSLVQV